MKNVFSSLMDTVSALLRDENPGLTTQSPSRKPSKSRLPWSTIYFADEICDHRILREIAQSHQVLVIKRGGCSFSQKLRNIAAYPPSRHALKLVIVVDYDENTFAEASTSTPPRSAGLAAIRAEPYSTCFPWIRLLELCGQG
jgi:hypothetical protein